MFIDNRKKYKIGTKLLLGKPHQKDVIKGVIVPNKDLNVEITVKWCGREEIEHDINWLEENTVIIE